MTAASSSPVFEVMPMVLAAAAAALWSGPSVPALLHRRLRTGRRSAPGAGRSRSHSWRSWRQAVARPVLWATVACAALLLVVNPSALLLGVGGGLGAGAVARLHVLGRRRHRADSLRRQATEACDALVGELRAGLPTVRALDRVAEDYPALRAAARACAFGGDVPAALRGVAGAGRSGAGSWGSGLSALAAAWQVAEGSGAGLAPTLERVADGLRTQEETRAEVASALAPARATARLLAVLPAFGLLLGSGLGGDPVGLLVGTTTGHLLLLAGVSLSLAGTLWVERIADTVEEP